MEDSLERRKLLEYRAQIIQQQYAKEIAELTKRKGYDVNLPKWDNKIQKIAKKYAKMLYPIQREIDEMENNKQGTN